MTTMKEIDEARERVNYWIERRRTAQARPWREVPIDVINTEIRGARARVELLLAQWWAQGCKEAVGGNLFDGDALPENKCNRHDDCAAADAKARAAGRLSAEHCHDSCCEDCFGA